MQSGLVQISVLVVDQTFEKIKVSAGPPVVRVMLDTKCQIFRNLVNYLLNLDSITLKPVTASAIFSECHEGTRTIPSMPDHHPPVVLEEQLALRIVPHGNSQHGINCLNESPIQLINAVDVALRQKLKTLFDDSHTH